MGTIRTGVLALSVVLRLFLPTTPAAAGEPQWIWGSPHADREAEVGFCDFRRTFDLPDRQGVEGNLQIACDNRYVVRLNGRLIGIGDAWQQWDAYDISSLLREGRNELTVRCRNDGGPAGLVCALRIESPAGGPQQIVSDDLWQAKLQRDGTWDPTIEARTPWSPAVALGPVGVTAPWGNGPQAAGEPRVVELAARVQPDGPFELHAGDRVLFVGGTLVERAQRFGYVEAALTAAFPDRDVIFRNLGWSGDTVWGEARARFGTAADGFEHLETHVYAERPTLIFVAYGGNEAFAGAAGLDTFVTGLNQLLDVLSTTGATLVLMTPVAQENLGPPLPDPRAQNRNVALYAQAIATAARERGCRCVDLFRELPAWARRCGETRPLTDNGIHLHRRGYQYAAQTLLKELGLDLPRVSIAIDACTGQVEVEGTELSELTVETARIRFSTRDHRLVVPELTPDPTVARRLQIRNLDPGRYTLSVDGQPIVEATADEWSAGQSLTAGPSIQQAQQLLTQIARKNELYFHRWRPANETYLFLFRKHEQGNNAVEIPQFDPLIAKAEESIRRLRQPQIHTCEVIRRADEPR